MKKQNKTAVIYIRVTPAQLENVRRAAERRGISVAQIIREMLANR